MQLLKVTATGEQHGLINSLGNSVQGDGFERFAPDKREEMKKLKKEECRLVKARYINHRGTNERLQATYCRWAGENLLCFNLIPGEEYELPYGFVKQVNETYLPKRSKNDGHNTNIGIVEGKDKIHELVPVGF